MYGMLSSSGAKPLIPALFDVQKLLLTFFAVVLLISGIGHPYPMANVYCYNNHTVDVTIINVDDVDEWTPIEWELQGNSACRPALSNPDETVTYTRLVLPDCAFNSIQEPDYIKYILKINVTKPNPGGAGQLRAYDHLYYIMCHYDNQNRSTASFIPIVNRNDNDTGMENQITVSFATFKSTTNFISSIVKVSSDKTTFDKQVRVLRSSPQTLTQIFGK